MSTQNRRVATYLPKEIDDRLKTFILERGLKGDSSALIVILSEYFGVSYQVAQKVDYSSFVTQEQFNDLTAKISALPVTSRDDKSLVSLLSKLTDKVNQLEDRTSHLEFLLGMPTGKEAPTASSKLPPGQMDFLNIVKPEESSKSSESELLLNNQEGELESELKVDSLSFDNWLSTKECWERLGKPGSYDTFRKAPAEKLQQLYGVQVNLEKKAEKKYNPRWLKLPS